jgi:hypothetical protein
MSQSSTGIGKLTSRMGQDDFQQRETIEKPAENDVRSTDGRIQRISDQIAEVIIFNRFISATSRG